MKTKSVGDRKLDFTDQSHSNEERMVINWNGEETTAFLPVDCFLILNSKFFLLWTTLCRFGCLTTAKAFVKASGDKSQMERKNESKSLTRFCWNANIYGQLDRVLHHLFLEAQRVPSVFSPFRRILHDRWTLRRTSSTTWKHQFTC